MKKFFIYTLAIVFLFAGIAIGGTPGWYVKTKGGNADMEKYFPNGHPDGNSAWEYMEVQPPPPGPCNDCGDVNASGYYEGSAGDSYDHSKSRSYWGFGDDYGEAGGNGFAGGSVTTFADADDITFRFFGKSFTIPGYAFETGFVDGYSETNAWSYASDFITTSMSGAGATTEGNSLVGGLAVGLGGCKEFVDTTATVGGWVMQENFSSEDSWLWGGTFAVGGSYSDAGYTASNYGYDDGRGLATGLTGISGSATVEGHTLVNVDPFGSSRSIYATTEAMSDINVCHPDFYEGSVSGEGFVQGYAVKGFTYGGGAANFSYSGDMSGNGGATISADIQTGSNNSSVHVSGSSFSTSQ